jgi:hypothetical protein
MKHYQHLVVGAVAALAFVAGDLRRENTTSLQTAKPVTVFFVRHAETGPRPKRLLAPEGEKRAKALQRLLGSTGITHVFSTDYPRTRGTIAPLAKAAGLKVELISSPKPDKQAAAIRALPTGSVAVVAGHSNTLPPLIAKLGGKVTGLTRRGLIVDEVHDRLFVMTFMGEGVSMVELRYGESARGKTAKKPKDKAKR